MREIAESMGRIARQDGMTETAAPGVRLYRTSRDVPRAPLIYKQGVLIMGQGAKRVHLGGKVYTYDPDHYLVLTVPLPAECEAQACEAEPLLAAAVDIDLRMLHGVIQQMEEQADQPPFLPGCRHHGLVLAKADPAFKETLLRLLRALENPLEGRMLGEGLVRELMFRILCGENAASLRALALKSTGLARIDKALRRIHDEFDRSFHVEQLAGTVNMSTSAFHRAFKDVTSLSPIQYLKRVRLTKAKSLLVEEGLRAGDAARRVGYESVSQFTREFKRYFGASPGELRASPRAR